MKSFFVVVGLIAFVCVVCQFSALKAVRRYIFLKYSRVRLRDDLLIFCGLFVLNIFFAFVSMNPKWAPVDSQLQKIVAVSFFTYLGITLSLGIFLAILKSMALISELAVAGYRIVLIMISGDLRGVTNDIDRQNQAQTNDRKHTSEGSASPASASDGKTGSKRSLLLEGISLFRWSKFLSMSATWQKRSRITAIVILVLFSGFGIYGVIEAYSYPAIERFEIKDKKLSGLEKPLSFIHVTDIHYGMFYDKAELEKLVEAINRINADAVFFTGDIYHSALTNVESSVEVFRKLKPRKFGNLVVMGNHDFYTGEERSIRALEASGLTLLRDDWRTIRDGAGVVHVAGLDDPKKNWLWGDKFPNFADLLGNAPEEKGYRILLSHRPAILPLASGHDFDLILAGHTHGGQVIVPGINSGKGWSLASFASYFTHGWYEHGRSRMYLNRGAGLTFMPWRINCSPEIAVFTLIPS